MDKTTCKAFNLSYEIMDGLLSQDSSLSAQTFAVLITHLVNSYATLFIPAEDHSEYFDDMAGNIQLLAKHARREVSH